MEPVTSEDREHKEATQVCLIQVPYMMGDEHHGGSSRAASFLRAGVQALLEDLGILVAVARVERGEPFLDPIRASLAVNKHLAAVARQAVAAGQLPLVLAGSCDVCMGILGGFEHAHCGVVWVDAHGDFNTPESTVTGFFAGMSLAVVVGHCYRDHWEQIGDNTPVAEAATLLLGARDLDPAERARLAHSAVRVAGWRDGEAEGDVLFSLGALADRTHEVYLHIDVVPRYLSAGAQSLCI